MTMDDPNWRCQQCKQARGPEGHDPCIAHLPGVNFACCGHGEEDGYISFIDGTAIYFTTKKVVRNNTELQRAAMRGACQLPTRALMNLPGGIEVSAYVQGNVVSIMAVSADRRITWITDNLPKESEG